MKVPVKAPSNLSEITLRQYQEFRQLKEPQSVDVLRIFLKLPIDIINKIPEAQVETIATDIVSMFNEDCPMINVFQLNGKRFGFIPVLNDMTHGEYLDATTYLRDKEEKDLHRCMAVLYRPITTQRKDKYLIEEYEGSSKYCDELLDMPVSIAMGCMVFFYNLLNDLLKAIPHYLLQNLTQEQLQTQVSFPSGEPITKYTQLQTSIQSLLVTLPKLTSIRR